jgi:hypothetical protein
MALGVNNSRGAVNMDKLEQLGCEKSVVGLVVPTGYSFNLDGTCLYLAFAAVFLDCDARAFGALHESGVGPELQRRRTNGAAAFPHLRLVSDTE